MNHHKILVVDADQACARLLQGHLEAAGYDVLTAYSGESALLIIRHEQPDLVVLELALPDQHGWDITRTIANDPQMSALRVIILSARAQVVDKIVALDLGADDYVTKPFNPRELVARIGALLRRSQLNKYPVL
jgi:DNA-binding response OmpR family regulator